MIKKMATGQIKKLLLQWTHKIYLRAQVIRLAPFNAIFG